MYELIYTSVPKGLIPGRSGFSTVAMSEGMPPNLIVPLENLSGYNFTLRDNTFLPILNPVCCYYIKMRYGNQQLHVAGRVAPNGLDYSQRNNKIAHHLLFESAEELENLSGGVAALFLKEGVFRTEYTEEPAMLPFRKVPNALQIGSLPAKNWAELSGHAGFAAFTAERFRETPDRPLYLIYPAGTAPDKLLNLVMEVCALLNPKVRSYFTFSTYFGSSTASVDCFLRMLPDFSPMVNNLRRFHKNDIIELGQENELPLTENYPDTYEYACTGKKPDRQQQPEEQTLTQHTIRILADSGLPPAPVKEMLAPPEEPFITVPPPQPSMSYKKFILAAVAAIIIAALVSLLLYDMPAKTNPQKKPSNIKNIRATAPAKPLKKKVEPPKDTKQLQKVLPAPVPVKQPVTASKQTPQPTPVKPPVQKPKPVKKTVQASLFDSPSLRRKAQAMPGKAAVQLFINFRMLPDNDAAQHNLELPEQLHGVSDLYVEMQRIGTSTITNSKFVDKGSRRGEIFVRAARSGVLPLQPFTGTVTDIPHLLIKISVDKKSLQIISYTGSSSMSIMPKPQNIKQIYFNVKNNIYVWHNRFSKSYVPLLQPGKLKISGNGQPVYEPGKLEKALSGFVETKFGNCSSLTFYSSSFYITDWNNAVVNCVQLRKKNRLLAKRIKAMHKHTGSPRNKKAVRNTMDDLQKLAKEGDISTVGTKFGSFLTEFFNIEEKTLVTADELKNFAENLASLLRDQQLSNENKSRVEKLNSKWKGTIALLKKFQDAQKMYSTERRKLNAAEENLKLSAQRTLNTAKNIHPEIENLLLSMIAENKTSSWQVNPSAVTGAEIESLTKAIIKKITFEPLDGE